MPGSEAGRETTHQAEPYRRGYEPNVVLGWHCLTCGTEAEGMTQEQAERAAEQHKAGREPSTSTGEVSWLCPNLLLALFLAVGLATVAWCIWQAVQSW